MMAGLEYLLFVVALVVLTAGVVIVTRGRRAELSAEREAAAALARMTNTLSELQRELAGGAGSAIRSDDDGESPTEARSELERAVLDHEALRVRLMLDHSQVRVHFGGRLASDWAIAPSDLMHAEDEDADAVLNLWEHLTREPEGPRPTYTDVMGPVFGDALIHAAKLGVMDREQAEVLKEWAETTSAVTPLPRGKRYSSRDVHELLFTTSADRQAVR